MLVKRNPSADFITAKATLRTIVASSIHSGRDMEDGKQALIDPKFGEGRMRRSMCSAQGGEDWPGGQTGNTKRG